MIAPVTLRPANKEGLLVRLKTGAYFFLAENLMEPVDGRMVAALQGKSGRPALATKAKRVALYLEEADIARAKKIGNGNLCQGVRAALEFVEKHQKND